MHKNRKTNLYRSFKLKPDVNYFYVGLKIEISDFVFGVLILT